MAAQKFDKNSEEWIMFMDYWQLCQKYYIPENTEEYWENLREDGKLFVKKHRNSFARELFMAFHNEMERKVKNV